MNDVPFNPGRFATAGRDITVGEVLAVEKAIVSHMLPEYMGRSLSSDYGAD